MELKFRPGEGPLVRQRTVGISRVTTSSDTSVVTVEFVGGRPGDIMTEPGRADYELEVDEATSPPTVTVWKVVPSIEPEPIGADNVRFATRRKGYFWKLQHEWSNGPRPKIRDGSNGQTHTVISLAGLLKPNVLPVGWTLKQSDGPPPPPNQRMTRFTDGTSTVYMHCALHEDPMVNLKTTRTRPDFTEIEIREGTRAETSTFEGRPELRFIVGSYVYELSAGQEVPPAVLLEIAEGVSE